GAALWLSTCADPCPHLQVDTESLRPGDHVRQYPEDGAVVRNSRDGGFYRFGGGAPLVVRCDIGPGCVNPPVVDGATFDNHGANEESIQRMRDSPADGTVLTNVDDGSFYRIAGEAPLPLSACSG